MSITYSATVRSQSRSGAAGVEVRESWQCDRARPRRTALITPVETLIATLIQTCLHPMTHVVICGARLSASPEWQYKLCRCYRAVHRRLCGRPLINAAKRLSELAGFHIVAVGTPVPRRRQERARAMCLSTLVVELHSYGVTELLMENRTRQLNQRDVRTVAGVRQRLLPRGAEFRVGHMSGAEPLLWPADIVAGAVRARQEGNLRYHEFLRDRVYEIDVHTEC